MKKLALGISFLVFSGFIVKVLGLIHKIVLVRILSLEGITFYTLATPTILLFFSLASFGLKEAVSKIVSENKTKETYSNRSVIIKALKYSFLISILLSLIMALGGSFLANILNEPKLYYLFLCSIPLCLIVSVGHVFKGYFSGLNMLNVISISQVIEQIVRIIASISLCLFLIKYGIVYASIGILLASFIGEVSSLSYMLYKASKITSFSFKHKSNPDDAKRIFETSIPLVTTHAISSCTYFLEPIVLTLALTKVGLTPSIINNLFGSVNGYVIPLLTLFGFISYSLSSGIIPSITSMYYKKEYQKISKLLNISLLVILIPSVFLLTICFFYPREVLNLLYDVDYGYKMVRYLSFFFLMYYTGIIFNSVLYVCDSKSILKISIISSLFKLIFLYVLCVIPNINSLGLIISSIISLSITFILSLMGCYKYLKFKIDYKMFFRFIMAFFITFTFIFILNNRIIFYQLIIISFLLYFSLILLFCKKFILPNKQ